MLKTLEHLQFNANSHRQLNLGQAGKPKIGFCTNKGVPVCKSIFNDILTFSLKGCSMDKVVEIEMDRATISESYAKKYVSAQT